MSNHTSVYNYGDPPEKFDPLPPAFQDHSRSRIDRLPMTAY